MMYNYYEAIHNDVCDYIAENINFVDFDTLEDMGEYLNDVLFCEDSVTGNASGSYTFNRYTAKEYVMENSDLCAEAMREFCVDAETVAENFLSENWEYFDVSIRCYLLSGCISDALETVAEDFEEAHAEAEQEG